MVQNTACLLNSIIYIHIYTYIYIYIYITPVYIKVYLLELCENEKFLILIDSQQSSVIFLKKKTLKQHHLCYKHIL